MRRLLLLLLTVLGCWLGSGPAGLTYAEPASPVSTYTYDVPADLSMVAEVTANRGPPSSTYGYGTYDAVDRWSHGAQARPETTLSPSTTTHAHTGVLTQAVRATTTTGAQVGSTHGDFSSLHRSGVAANTAEGAADAALAAGRTSGAAAELNVGGQVITDVSTGGASRSLNPAVQAALDDVPLGARAPWHGACAEMGCLSQAIERGINPSGGSIRAVAIGESNPGHGLPKAICSSCQNVLARFGVTW